MRNQLRILLGVFLLTTPTASSENLDADLAKYPAFYRSRIQKFRTIIRQEPNRQAKIQRALALASKSDSVYRKDAIRFLSEVKAVETAPQLIAVAKRSEEVRDEVVVALNHFQTKESITYLIECLNDPDITGNIRSMAYNGLRNITQQEIDYRFDGLPEERQNGYQRWLTWWQQNKATFVKPVGNREEQDDADENWKKYALPYLNK